MKLPVAIEADLSSTLYTETRQAYVPQTPEVYSYDEAGNLLTDGRRQYTGGAENRLVQLTTVSEAVTAGMDDLRLVFTYDSQGRRVQKEV